MDSKPTYRDLPGRAGTGVLLAVLTVALTCLAGAAPAQSSGTASALSSSARTAATAPATVPAQVAALPAASAMESVALPSGLMAPTDAPLPPSAQGSAAAAPAGTPEAQAAQGRQETAGEDLDSLLGPEPPTRVRVAILDATGKPGGANKVAVLLSQVKRRALEDQIGLQVDLVNVSTADTLTPGRSTLYYRPEFLHAALAIAEAIPGEQFVQPMRPAGLKRAGVDVEIVIGEILP